MRLLALRAVACMARHVAERAMWEMPVGEERRAMRPWVDLYLDLFGQTLMDRFMAEYRLVLK